ncbi:ABC transporter ATP-binding protein [Clostridium sp. DL1XJH146]
MSVLQVKDVRKSLSGREIIKGISFEVNKGEIFGFLGPNGAGKTTTIKMLTGLMTQESGRIIISEYDIQKDREKALEKVGAIVENPEFYEYLSGYENLMQVARVRNIPVTKVMEAAEMVGLKDRITDKVKKYSLGMKQRLGLAMAIITEPELLILDEPTNGLDPNGIIFFRNVVRQLASKGTAVFISSHILSEIEQVCHKAAFIKDGEIQSVELLGEEATIKTEFKYNIITSKGKEALSLLNQQPCVKEIYLKDSGIEFMVEQEKISHLIFKLSDERIPIEEIYKVEKELEERYLELVEGENL